jgi:hypothetical protein
LRAHRDEFARLDSIINDLKAELKKIPTSVINKIDAFELEMSMMPFIAENR